jgi:dCMP deaminase
MCRRQIINAGIKLVICPTGETTYTITNVRDWVFNDDSLEMIYGEEKA